MIKKALVISLVILFFFNLFILSTIKARAEEEIKSTAPMSSLIEVNWTTSNEPIMPIDDLRYYPIKIDYSIILGPLGRLFLPFFLGRQINIKLSVKDSNPWCTANIAIDTLTTKVQPEGSTNSLTTEISIELDKDAPAYSSGYATFQVSTPPIKGKFGKITFIDGCTQNFTIKFKPAYLALIQAELPQGNSIEISPYTETIFPIDITNFGNARTLVRFEIGNTSKSFNITTKEILIDVDEKRTAELVLFADHKFDEEKIKIKMTPVLAENPTNDIGESTDITINVTNDGSYVEEEPYEIDLTMLIIFLVIILIIVVAFKILKRK